LAARSQPARWLIVATACTSDAGPDAGGMERLQQSLQASESADVLEMCPFTQHQVARYLDSRFGPGCVTSLAPIVEELTGGNPLMLVAAADGLIEQGFVTADSHGWHRRADGADMREVLIRVLHDPISRQIERLTPLERAIVEAASAVGLEFSVDMVARASGLSPDEVGTLLGRLARRNAIIRPVLDTSRPRLGPGLAFRFRHAAYAEAVAEHAPILQQIFAARRLRRSVSREVSIS
jgi:predicted ATPase